MNTDPRDWFRGSLIVARRDLFANAKSVKLVVISALMLLIMVAAAFGISGLGSILGPGIQNEYVLWLSPAYDPANLTPPGIVAWVSDAFGHPREGVDVALGEPWDPFGEANVFVERETKITNGTGWVAFAGLAPGFWPVEMRVENFVPTNTVRILVIPPTSNLTAAWRQFDLLQDGSLRDAALHLVDKGGAPLGGAEVRVNGTLRGTTDGNGFFTVRLDVGRWTLNATYAGESTTSPITVYEPRVVLPIFSGPDNILFFLAYGFMGLFGPMLAIAMSYDALAKERLQGSLELLLVRPASRTGLAVGKFLGTFISVGLPVFGVCLAGLAAISGVTGKWPDAGFALTFLWSTLGLLATYILIMQIFSTFVKSPGTAILSAIMVWLIFNLIWNVVVLVVQAAFAIQGGTEAAFLLSAVSALFNPTGVYQLVLSGALPPSISSGSAGGYGLPDWSGPVAMLLWVAALLVLAVLLFRKKVV